MDDQRYSITSMSRLGLFGKRQLKEEVIEAHKMMNGMDGADRNQFSVALTL